MNSGRYRSVAVLPGTIAILISKWSGFGTTGQIAVVIAVLALLGVFVWAWERSKALRSLEDGG